MSAFGRVVESVVRTIETTAHATQKTVKIIDHLAGGGCVIADTFESDVAPMWRDGVRNSALIAKDEREYGDELRRNKLQALKDRNSPDKPSGSSDEQDAVT